MKLTEIEKKDQNLKKEIGLKSDQDKTWFVNRTGKYTMDEISKKLSDIFEKKLLVIFEV